MKRGLAVIAVAALLVLAGCNGGGGAGTAEPTATDAANGTATPGSDGAQTSCTIEYEGTGESMEPYEPTGPLPPASEALQGVTESGLENDTAIWTGHFQQLYTNNTHYTENVQLQTGSGSARWTYTNGSQGDLFSLTNETDGRSVDFWAATSSSMVAQRNQSKTPAVTIGQGGTSLSTSYRFTSGLIRVVPSTSLTRATLADAGTTTLDGEEVYRFDVTGYNAPDGKEFLNIYQNATAASGTLLVDRRGVIREANVAVTLESDGETTMSTMNYTASDVGAETGAPPDWVGTYPQASVSTEQNGQVLAVAVENCAIPSGTDIRVGREANPYGNVTLSESVSAGDTLYVVAGGAVGNRTADAQVGSAPSLPSSPASFTRSRISISMTIDGKEIQFAPPSRR